MVTYLQPLPLGLSLTHTPWFTHTQVDVVTYLLHEGADATAVDARKENAQHKAAQLGHEAVARFLRRWVDENLAPINAGNS